MKKNTSFLVKYPLLETYIMDEHIKQKLMYDEKIYDIYSSYNNLIKYFILEMENHFEKEFISEILIEVLTNYSKDIFVKCLSAYLNSNDEYKNNLHLLNSFQKLKHLNDTEMKFVEKNGLQCLYNEDKLSLSLDEKFSILNNNYTFKNFKLDFIWKFLSENEKELLISLIENNSFKIFKKHLNKLNFGLKNILNGLVKYNLNYKLFTKEANEVLDEKKIMLIVLACIYTDNNENLHKICDLLINEEYYQISNIVSGDLLKELIDISNDKTMKKNYA